MQNLKPHNPDTLKRSLPVNKSLGGEGVGKGWGWRESSVVKSTGCSFRGSGYNSQHPQLTTVCNFSSRGSDTLTQTDMQAEH
jgi:hypothetical protein